MSEEKPSRSNEAAHGMTIREAMQRVGAEALDRYRQNSQMWEDFYAVCTTVHVRHYLWDYLDQFSLDGTQTRRTYDLEVSICLAEGLRRARQREDSDPQPDAVSEQLAAYNDAIRSHILTPDYAALATARFNLASAMLLSE